MVGVAGKSKGCHTCIKRRVKCDETKPICKRCTKAGYTCAGYNRPLRFLNSFQDGFSARTNDENITTRIKDISITPSPPPELGLVAFKDNICFSYLMDNFVWRTYGSPWFELAALGKMDRLSLDSCQALSQINFGSHYHQGDMQVQGAIQYGSVLRSLIPRLARSKEPGMEALVVPIMILLMYASSQGDRAGSGSHVAGLTQLLCSCGPEAFYSGTMRSAFESCRATLITVGLITKRRTFLEEPRWRTASWPSNTSPTDEQSRLTDLLALVPGLLDDKLLLDNGSKDLHPSEFISRLTSVLIGLFRWRWEWDEENLDVSSSEEGRTHRCRPSLQRLHFSSSTQASDIMLYNSVLMWIIGLLNAVSPHSAQKKIMIVAISTKSNTLSLCDDASPLLFPGQKVQLRDLAIEICQAFEWQIHNIKNHRSSSRFFLMPVGMAWSVLEKDEEYRTWITGMLDSSRVTRGYALSGNSFGFGNYAFPSISEGLT
ncbi:hypothetical protein BGZ60DRAFT_532268 [Tricladium varicosporioides]|nr:hypothetical protein BGZ60DRAFT_532268 [Hymenoscyphus varicosporioides]